MSDIVSDLQSFNEEKLNPEPYTCEEIAKAAADEITRLREENSRLREVLKPFAARLDDLEKSPLTKYACATLVEIEHLRAARAAVREGGKDEN